MPSIEELLEHPVSTEYPNMAGVALPRVPSWYRAMYQYVGHLANQAANVGGHGTMAHVEKASRAARLLAWTATMPPQHEPPDDVRAFRAETASLALIVLAGQLLAYEPPSLPLLSDLTVILSTAACRMEDETPRSVVSSRMLADCLAAPLHAASAARLLAEACDRRGSSRVRYNLACFASETIRWYDRAREPVGSESMPYIPGRSGLRDDSPGVADANENRTRLLSAAWLFLHDAVLGPDLSQWAWRDPSLTMMRQADRAKFAAAAGPEPDPPDEKPAGGVPTQSKSPTDDDLAKALNQRRIDAVVGDRSVLQIATRGNVSLVEADLLYQDLTPGRPAHLVREHLLALGGKHFSEEGWIGRTPTSAKKDLPGYLKHLRDDLDLEVWEFPAFVQDGRTVDDIIATIGNSTYPTAGRSVYHVPVYATASSSLGPLGALGPYGAPAPALSPAEAEPTIDMPVSRVRLAVLDTGLPADYSLLHPHLRRVVAANHDEEDSFDRDGNLSLDAGHGLFILDVVHRLAPFMASIDARRATRNANNVTLGDHLIGLDLWELGQKALRSRSQLIVNMSFGAVTPDDMPGIGLQRELEWLTARGCDYLAVVAAGNNGDDRKTFPAACDLPNVISVGALDQSGRVAAFSNRGDWVDCWTTGVDVIGAYLSGVYDHAGYRASFRRRDPYASWSGTSFAAPRVAAAIALKAATMPDATLVTVFETLRKENRNRHPHWSDDSGRFFSEHGVVIDVP